MSRPLIRRRLTQDVTLHLREAGAEDDHGNPILGEVPMVVKGFATQQAPRETAGGEILSEGFRLFLTHDAPLTGWDAVTVAGLRYEVIGPPWRVYNPRSQEYTHIEADLARAGT